MDTDHVHRKKDVDHRNLITLTESPKENSPKWDDNNKMDQVTTQNLLSILNICINANCRIID